MHWVETFYDRQDRLSGLASRPVGAEHRAHAEAIGRLAGSDRRVLELGAGGGQAAAAAATAGHTVVAVELVERLADLARGLEAGAGSLEVVQGDFYEVDPGGPFDVVCYWDGFGIGSDDDQRRLLARIESWLEPDGIALIEVYTPWHAASSAGHGGVGPGLERRYGFDARACRWLDSWWPAGRPEEAVTQTLRCYSPADLRMLLEPLGLELVDVEPGGFYDYGEKTWHPEAPLERALSYIAILRPGDGPR